MSTEHPFSQMGALSGSRDLAGVEGCRLVEEDGSRWEVVDVVLDGRRAWITARPDGEQDEPRTFDTVLGPGTMLVWDFDDGSRLRMWRSTRDGRLRWERRPPAPPSGFFGDPFLESGG